jgi:hypothetical protein
MRSGRSAGQVTVLADGTTVRLRPHHHALPHPRGLNSR